MKLYTCAFAFAAEPARSDNVLLIRKAKPDWQRGLLNGIGGKVEVRNGFIETINEATIREFKEETGLDDIAINPLIFHSMLWPEYRSHTDWPLVYFSAFTLPFAVMKEAVGNTMMATEPCVLCRTKGIQLARHELMPNLPFLIEMAQCLVLCSPEDRKLRQPVVPSPSDWAEYIQTGTNLALKE
jgi:hypothetical protein